MRPYTLQVFLRDILLAYDSFRASRYNFAIFSFEAYKLAQSVIQTRIKILSTDLLLLSLLITVARHPTICLAWFLFNFNAFIFYSITWLSWKKKFLSEQTI